MADRIILRRGVASLREALWDEICVRRVGIDWASYDVHEVRKFVIDMLLKPSVLLEYRKGGATYFVRSGWPDWQVALGTEDYSPFVFSIFGKFMYNGFRYEGKDIKLVGVVMPYDIASRISDRLGDLILCASKLGRVLRQTDTVLVSKERFPDLSEEKNLRQCLGIEDRDCFDLANGEPVVILAPLGISDAEENYADLIEVGTVIGAGLLNVVGDYYYRREGFDSNLLDDDNEAMQIRSVETRTQWGYPIDYGF